MAKKKDKALPECRECRFVRYKNSPKCERRHPLTGYALQVSCLTERESKRPGRCGETGQFFERKEKA